MTNPLVSIIIPVYNGSAYLGEAIDSALCQTYPNIEVLVINDGSADDGATERVALSYGERIRYFSKENGGVSSALNLGIKEMRGDYFSWLSHDDAYLPEKVAKQVALIPETAEDTIILCEYDMINETGDVIRKPRRKGLPSGTPILWEDGLLDILRNGTFNGCCLLVPKKCFEVCGLFNETMRYSQDAEMWMRFFLSRFSLVYTGESLVLNRVHQAQVTNTRKDLFVTDAVGICEQYFSRLNALGKGGSYAFLLAKKFADAGVKEAVDYCCGQKALRARERLELRTALFLSLIKRKIIRPIYYRVINR